LAEDPESDRIEALEEAEPETFPKLAREGRRLI
jgi:hypothetical protein